MIEEEALEARQMLEENNPPGWVSLVVAVYRDSPEELSSALQDLIRRMPTANSEIATEVEKKLKEVSERTLEKLKEIYKK